MAKKKKINTMSLQSYKATLSQSGSSNPTVDEFINEGFDGDWVRNALGDYYKETSIAPNGQTIWIGGTAMSFEGETRYPVYKGEAAPAGFYSVQYGWTNLKLRLIVKCYNATGYEPIELSSLMLEYNEIFLPEIILKTP